MIRIFLFVVLLIFLGGCSSSSKYGSGYSNQYSYGKYEYKTFDSFRSSAWFKDYDTFVSKSRGIDFGVLTNSQKMDLLSYASYNKDNPCRRVNYLIKKGVTLSNYNRLFIKSSYGRFNKGIESMQCFKNLGANVFASDSYYGNALEYAVQAHTKDKMNNTIMIKYLLSLGLNPMQASRKNKPSAYQMAKNSGNKSLIYMLSPAYISTLPQIGGDGLSLNEYIKKNELAILTEYFINERLNIPKPSLPQKPKEPELPKEKTLKKGEFETTAMFNQRVKKEKKKLSNKIVKLDKEYRKKIDRYNQKVKKISNEYNKKVKFLQDNMHKVRSIAFNKAYGYIYGKPLLKDIKYDADKQKFFAKVVSSKRDLKYNIEFEVPLTSARKTKKELAKVSPKMIFEYKNGKMLLKDIDIPLRKNTLTAYVSNKNYKDSDVLITVDSSSLKLEKPDFVKPSLIMAQNDKKIKVIGHDIDNSVLSNGDDLEKLLSKVKPAKLDDNKYALVVGIEDYRLEPKVNFSTNSAQMFGKYLNKALGVPKKNVWIFTGKENTTSGFLKSQWANFLQMLDNKSVVYFYYSGHGIPSLKDGSPYLLPADLDSSLAQQDSTMKLQNVYKALENTKAKHIYSFVDSCFSGKDDSGKLVSYKGVAPILRGKKVRINKNKMTILTAGSSKQFSNQYKEKSHRLFSYFIMKGLSDGKTDIEQLHSYVKKNVATISKEIGNGHFQVPQLDGKSDIKLF
jgi:hypothetical protein